MSVQRGAGEEIGVAVERVQFFTRRGKQWLVVTILQYNEWFRRRIAEPPCSSDSEGVQGAPVDTYIYTSNEGEPSAVGSLEVRRARNQGGAEKGSNTQGIPLFKSLHQTDVANCEITNVSSKARCNHVSKLPEICSRRILLAERIRQEG